MFETDGGNALKMRERVERFCGNEGLLDRGMRIAVALSGGPDSVCLLDLMLGLAKQYDLQVFAVHVHHGLRKGADSDLAFVAELCGRCGIRLLERHFDVRTEAKERGMSLEEAGRAVRYEYFGKLLQSGEADRVALGHHLDDQAETVLWNILRGSDLSGLRGMLPKRGGYIRPLLCVSRSEIISYLEEKKLRFCEDETNRENDCTRNRIRNVLLPLLEEEYNAGSRKHITDLAGTAREAEAFLETETKKAYEKTVSKEDGGLLYDVTAASAADPYIQRRLLYRMAAEAAGSAKDISRTHILILEDLLSKREGKSADLPYDLTAVRTGEGLLIRKKEKSFSFTKKGSSGVPNENLLPGEPWFSFEHLEVDSDEARRSLAQGKRYTKCFDYDIIKAGLSARTRMAGDYFIIDEEGSRQKLKDYFINEKVPRGVRDSIPLLAEGSSVLWAAGFRIGEPYKITGRTKRVLAVSLVPSVRDFLDNMLGFSDEDGEPEGREQ